MMKRLLPGMLLLLLAGFAWGSGDEEAAAESGGVPEIEFLGFFEFTPDATADTEIFAWWGEAVGARIVPINVATEDQATRVQTMIAARDVPDVMHLSSPDVRNIHFDFGPRGAFVNVSEQLDAGNMPNLAEVLKAAPDGLKIAPDGNSYALPQFNMWANGPMVGIKVRKDHLTAGGWSGDIDDIAGSVRTLEDWEEAFAAVYRGYNQGREPQPMIINRRGSAIRGWVVRPMTHMMGTWIRMWYDDSDTYVWGPATNRFRGAMEFLSTAYANGWLHPAWVTMTEEEQVALYEKDGYAVFFGPIGGNFGDRMVNKPAEHLDLLLSQEVNLLPPVYEGMQARIRAPKRVSDSAIVIDANSAVIDAAVRMIDYAYSDAGAELLNYGPEGYAWERDGNPYWGRRWILNWSGFYPAAEVEADPARSKTRGLGIGQFSVMHPSDTWGKDNLGRYYDVTQPGVGAQMPNVPVIEQFQAAGVWNATPEPSFPFTPEEQEEKNSLEAALATYVDEQVVAFVNGHRPLSEWGDFVQTLQDLGHQRLEEIYRTALERYRSL